MKSAQVTDAQLKNAQVEHTLYEDAPARVEVRYKYKTSDKIVQKIYTLNG
jgi:hypothetical protein